MTTRSLTSDPLAVLLAHNRWSIGNVLAACRPLRHEEFHQRFQIGLGSLHLNLTHIVSVERRWCDRIAQRSVRPMLHEMPGWPSPGAEVKDRTPDELLAMHEEACDDLDTLAAAWREHGLHTTVSMDWPAPGGGGGKQRHTFTRGAIFTHVATHNLYHVAQCVNMLRHVNVPGVSDKLPVVGVVEWQSAIESPPVPVSEVAV